MNILASIEPDILTSVFGWDRDTVADKVSLLASKIDITRFRDQEDTDSKAYRKMFSDVSDYLCDQLITIITNRRNPNPKRISAFEAADLMATNRGNVNTFYIVGNNRGGGANSFVFMKTLFKATQDQPFVEGLLKEMVKNNTGMMYELITQIYLQQATLSYSFMSVPRLIAVRKTKKQGNHPGNVFAFMERVQAPFFKDLDKDTVLIALAHLMKCLFVLQHKYHFMHRDLHDQNVAYDAATHTIHFIDFGYSCINPDSEDLAWQVNQEFYPIMYNSRSAKCDNPSLDVCCIVGSLVRKHSFLLKMHEEMKKVYTEKLKNKTYIDQGDRYSTNLALQNMSKPDNNLFTLAKGENWKVGNKNEDGLPQWWVYDMGEVSVPEFYPAFVLIRLLGQIPLEEWVPIRQSFAELNAIRAFDGLTIETNYRVSYKGNAGTIQQLTDDGNFRVRFDIGGEAHLSASKLKRKK